MCVQPIALRCDAIYKQARPHSQLQREPACLTRTWKKEEADTKMGKGEVSLKERDTK